MSWGIDSVEKTKDLRFMVKAVETDTDGKVTGREVTEPLGVIFKNADIRENSTARSAAMTALKARIEDKIKVLDDLDTAAQEETIVLSAVKTAVTLEV